MIGAGTVVLLSLSQFLCWGIGYYMIGVFGPAIAAETGWTLPVVYGGFSGALIVMGLSSGPVGRMIDQYGGRPVMTVGSALLAVGFCSLALSHSLAAYGASWLLVGLALRMTLYEAAFATLAHLVGRAARKPISRITLLGGLASSAFWPVGDLLVSEIGWRNGLFVYAALAVVSMTLHWFIPATAERFPEAGVEPTVSETSRPKLKTAALLFALMNTVSAFLNSGLSAHMVAIIGGFGFAAGVAVGVSSLRGVGQSLARLAEIAAGSRVDSFVLGVVAAAALVCSIGFALAEGVVAAIIFAFVYGIGIGLLTIVRGIQPLELFDPRSYGRLSGWMLMPGFIASAFAPVVYAAIIESQGQKAAIVLSLVLALGTLACAIAMQQLLRKRGATPTREMD
ncbi:MFS transporter [Rhizobium sp. XQZ8]|uniref:MFS transporter n=1 Tax=Rhizobium populisoli TaxID=2859785 RepID=UPI001CA5AB58|nr:MFS transporter [Rhizobium populisoli]MBW6424956.1 MFS transporter [Rhizobium populisoli]